VVYAELNKDPADGPHNHHAADASTLNYYSPESDTTGCDPINDYKLVCMLSLNPDTVSVRPDDERFKDV
jgi:hypothetical protein